MDTIKLPKPLPFLIIKIETKPWFKNFNYKGKLLVYQHKRKNDKETSEWIEFRDKSKKEKY